jgi:hypothetical protein
MKRIVLLICISTAGMCINYSCNQKKATIDTATSVYPKLIEKYKLERQYDKTKWMLYCIHCDEFCEFDKRSGISDTITFGMLSLHYEGVDIFNDTAELNFSFYYKDSIKCDYGILRNANIDIGAAYHMNSDSILYYLRLSTYNRHWETGQRSRYQYPLQPEVIKYIKTNRKNLDIWFRAEAIRRGIIEKE